MLTKKQKMFFSLPLVFFLTAALLFGFLLLSTLVPKEAIRPRMQTSAEYLCDGELFGAAVPGVLSSRIDRYADSILLGIAWQYDRENALRSVLLSEYYHLPYQNENVNLRDAVTKDLPANQQYLRYWHGSAGLVRILTSFLTLPQIYLWHGILLGGLFLTLLIRLIRRRERALGLGLLIGAVGITGPLVPLSLEYTWVFLILLAQLHLLISRRFPKTQEALLVFFLVSGMVTNYLDFLTCETLTLLVPLLVLLWIGRGQENVSWKSLFFRALSWLAGYAGMFLAKWLLAGAVMGENPFPYVLEHIEERTIGAAGDAGFFQELLVAPFRNLASVFPMGYGALGTAIACAALLFAVYVGYVYRRKTCDKALLTRLAAVGAVPYLRYLALANHSYLHYFFTFRAQLAALLAAALILGELVERKGGRREKG